MKKFVVISLLLIAISMTIGCADKAQMRRDAVKQSSEQNSRQGMMELDRETK